MMTTAQNHPLRESGYVPPFDQLSPLGLDRSASGRDTERVNTHHFSYIVFEVGFLFPSWIHSDVNTKCVDKGHSKR